MYRANRVMSAGTAGPARPAPSRQPSARRWAFALVLALCCSAGARAQQTPTLRVAVLPADAGAQVFYAADEGLFKRAGLDVQVTVTNPAAIPPAVASGTYDIGHTNVATLAAAREHGEPFVMIAPSAVYSAALRPTAAIVVGKSSPLRTGRDFDGKIVAVNGLQNIGEVTTEAWIDKTGGDSSTVKFIEMPFDAMIPAIEQGRVDAGEFAEPALDEALARGQRIVSPGYDAVAKEFVIGGWFCTSAFASAHPDLVRKFAQVMVETARWANAHQSETAPILAKWTKLQVSPAMPRVVYGDRLSAALIQPIIDVSVKYHALKAPMSATELFAPGL